MNDLVVTLVMVLIPGILATVIFDNAAVHAKWDSFRFGVYAFLFGIASYAVLQGIIFAWDAIKWLCYDSQAWSQLSIWEVAFDADQDVSGIEIFLASLLAVPTAFSASWVLKGKFLNRFALWLGVSNKYGDENLYSYFLNADDIDWVYIRVPADGLTYQGRVISHSENNAVQEIVLAEVSVFNYSDSTPLYEIPRLYISKPHGVLTIEAVPLENLGEV